MVGGWEGTVSVNAAASCRRGMGMELRPSCRLWRLRPALRAVRLALRTAGLAGHSAALLAPVARLGTAITTGTILLFALAALRTLALPIRPMVGVSLIPLFAFHRASPVRRDAGTTSS